MGKWSAKDKARIVLEVLAGGQTVTSTCRSHGALESVYYRWQKKFLEDAHLVCCSKCRGVGNKRGPHPGTGAAGGADGPGTGGLKKKPLASTVKGKAGTGEHPQGPLPPAPSDPGPASPPEQHVLPQADHDRRTLAGAPPHPGPGLAPVRIPPARGPAPGGGVFGRRREGAFPDAPGRPVGPQAGRQAKDHPEPGKTQAPEPSRRALPHPSEPGVGCRLELRAHGANASGDLAQLMPVMDLWIRRVLGFTLGPRITEQLTLSALDMVLAGGRPEIHHSDQGVQYTSKRYVARLRGLGVALSYAGADRAWENGHVERLLRTVKEEWANLREYGSLAEARATIEAPILDVYNRQTAALGSGIPDAGGVRGAVIGRG